jgi:hypothetical protein
MLAITMVLRKKGEILSINVVCEMFTSFRLYGKNSDFNELGSVLQIKLYYVY